MDENRKRLDYFQSKHLRLLNTLVSSEGWQDSVYLANAQNISIRTLRNYVATINGQNSIILSSKDGYLLNPVYLDDIKQLLKESSTILEDASLRKNRILKKLLLSNKPISIQTIADDLYYSSATINSDLAQLKDELMKQDICIEKKKNMISISGNENALRKKLSDMLYEEMGENFINITVISSLFPRFNISELENKIVDSIAKHGFKISDYSLHNVCIHICIMLDRINISSMITTQKSAYLSDIDKRYITITEDIFAYLCDKYEINIDESEIYPIALAFSMNIKMNHHVKIEMNQVSVSDSTREFVEELVSDIQNMYSIDLDYNNFTIRFSLHLEQWLKNPSRSHKNPLLSEIKNSYPLVFELAAYTANKIHKQYNSLDINDYEISYIALHLGMSFENNNKRVKAILITGDYYNLRDSLIEKVTSTFGSSIEIVSSYSSTREINESVEYDFVITTNKNVDIANVKYVTISPFLVKSDISRITAFLDKNYFYVGSEKAISLLKYISRDFFVITDDDKISKTNIISQLCFKMMDKNIVSEAFYDEVLKREELSSTAYLNFAIPHPFDLNKNNTAVAVYVLRNGAKWDDNIVNIVFLISVCENDKQEFRNIISYITTIFTSNEWTKKCKNLYDYNDFVDFLLGYDK